MKKALWVFAVVLFGCTDSPPTIDGHTYKTVQIGEQEWFAENLKTTVYANGDEIPYSRTDESWTTQEFGTRCSYDHDEAHSAQYGHLYNWYAVDDERGLCPSGWHVPSDEEWMDLEVFLGMSRADVSLEGSRGSDELDVGDKLGNGTDDFGFSSLAGGYRYMNGFFDRVHYSGYFWSASYSANNWENAWFRMLGGGYTGVNRNDTTQRNGFSVRCVRD